MASVSMPMNDRSRPSLPVRASLLLLAAFVALSALPMASATPAAGTLAQQSQGGEEVIVVLANGADPIAAARELGVDVTHVYRHVFTGFAGTLPPGALATARASRSVQRISPDGDVQIEAQTIPTGVRRSGVPHQPGADHLDIASPIDADIAILDTGVARRSDLKVADGKSCVKTKKDKRQKRKQRRDDKRTPRWDDDNGHGTHTAGIAAALDNDQNVVGVAPGARIWAAKVVDARGNGSFSDVICGLDWVVKHKDEIDVVNLSLGADGEDGDCASTAFHQAICNTVANGIPVVVAAGNQGRDAGTRVPAAYDEVIAVSAFADSDGAPGGDGPNTCERNGDDTFLNYSNFGPDVDIMAPGDCIVSLDYKGGTTRESGTSEAAPHVAGAAADYIAQQGDDPGTRPSPAQTRDWLLTQGSRPQAQDGVTGDDDGSPEPVLWLEVLEAP